MVSQYTLKIHFGFLGNNLLIKHDLLSKSCQVPDDYKEEGGDDNCDDDNLAQLWWCMNILDNDNDNDKTVYIDTFQYTCMYMHRYIQIF